MGHNTSVLRPLSYRCTVLHVQAWVAWQPNACHPWPGICRGGFTALQPTVCHRRSGLHQLLCAALRDYGFRVFPCSSSLLGQGW